MTPWAVMLRAALVLSLLLASAPASAQIDEAQARTMRASARTAVAEGRVEEAFGLFRNAAEQTADPGVWVEMGEVAERLRLDAAAVEAYQTFLTRVPDAPNRAEIEGRVRVLRHHLTGARYALSADGRSIEGFVDWDGVPQPTAPPTQNMLVDWQGNPQHTRASRADLLSLAEWDGTMDAPRPDTGAQAPTPVAQPGPAMGRALAAP